MKLTTITKFAAVAVAATALSASAVTIDFGTSWPAFTAPGAGSYSSAPLDRLIGKEDGTHSNETTIANYLNGVVGSSFAAGDIHKTDNPPELGGSDGYFTVPAGWNYLVVQYDGPNGGSIVLKLDGNDAKVPYDSSLIWGTGDQYGVSHFSVAGPNDGGNNNGGRVPDGGATAGLLGLGMLGLAAARKASK